MARAVDDRLAPQRKSQGDIRNLAVHGNKIVQHLVFTTMDKAILNDMPKDFKGEIDSRTDAVFTAMKTVTKKVFFDAYLGRLFYNQTKTKEFVAQTQAQL